MQVSGEFHDNANKFIIALDFDGTLTMKNVYPDIAKPRRFAREMTYLLHKLGVVVIVWTCRDHEDIKLVYNWLNTHNIYYHDVNSVIEHAPFHYESRKIYAHMYVDDMGYGWNDHEYVLVDVAINFMTKIMKIPVDVAHKHVVDVIGEQPFLEDYKHE